LLSSHRKPTETIFEKLGHVDATIRINGSAFLGLEETELRLGAWRDKFNSVLICRLFIFSLLVAFPARE
jgi:hypothetical protein